LPEALKARIITTGEGLTTFVLHPLQKFMWGRLQRHKTFSLTGREVNPETVETQLGSSLDGCPFGDRCVAPCRHGTFYVSGDYSDATNNLAPWLSNAIADEISDICGLRDDEHALFRRSLTGNVFRSKVDGKMQDLPQKWGQLMGSIVSFPVLCIANAAMTRKAIELGRGRVLSLQDCRMLINGDDVCFKSDFPTYRYWEKVTAFGGLENSLGKTYVTREFVQINSANYWRRSTPRYVVDDVIDREGKVETVFRERWLEFPGMVNFGLLMGMKRSAKVDHPTADLGLSDVLDTEKNLSMRAEKLVSVCPPSLREPVLKLFVDKHRHILKRTRVPWYIPTRFGGAGIPYLPTLGDTAGRRLLGPSDMDMQILRKILGDRDASGKLKYPVGRPPLEVDWDTHQLVMKSIPSDLFRLGTPTDEEQTSWSRVYNAFCFTQMFHTGGITRLRPGLDSAKASVRRKAAASRGLRVLGSNEQSWTQAKRAGHFPDPLPLNSLVLLKAEKPIMDIGTIHTLYPRGAPEVLVHAAAMQL